MRVGVYGGTFDPPHVGHLAGASEAAAVCALEKVIFVVAGSPWQKTRRLVTPSEDRLAMTLLATERQSGFEVSRIEVDRDGPSFTADTLKALAAPELELVFVAGSDALADLDTWHRADLVKEIASFAVLRRPGSTLERARAALRGAQATEVDMPLLEIASTDIRDRVANSRPIRFLVPRPVEDYIRVHGLYSPAPRS